jgi:hypothetical protein
MSDEQAEADPGATELPAGRDDREVDDREVDAEADGLDIAVLEVDVVEVDVLEVDVVTVDVVEVDAETAFAARDAALEAAAHEDESLDEALEHVDDGGTEVRESHMPTGPGELPLLIPGRERFAALDPLPVTGDARVDAGTARLAELADLPTADHVPVYDDVHHRLQDALADADPA